MEEIPIPEDIIDEVAEWREKLVEAVAELDELEWKSIFEDPNSLQKRKC